MATPIAMPRQGNSVESCTITAWHKQKGDSVKKGDELFSYETDKASFEFEAPEDGTLLEIFCAADADVPVLSTVAVLGQPGEDIAALCPATAQQPAAPQQATPAPTAPTATTPPPAAPTPSAPQPADATHHAVSPRARAAAQIKGVDTASLNGSGPKGRVIERDVVDAVSRGAFMTKSAAAALDKGDVVMPSSGSGMGGRIRLAELLSAQAPTTPAAATPTTASNAAEYSESKLSKMRTLIAERMMGSLQSSAQLTMTASADATQLLAYRAQLKSAGEALGLSSITINDLVAYAVSRVLPRFTDVNATLQDSLLRRYSAVHLAMAVDTERGLMVPVVRHADRLCLNDLAQALKLKAVQCQQGSVNPDDLSGGTFTISNLGAFGVESFTPVLNPPQVAILGVNTITQRPAQAADGTLCLKPMLGLSLTIDHRALDGAPAARFLKALVTAVENFNLTLSL
jgi:pyruvate dehydrogenase E2 component (dihydrolipoamide acetyltransferase)